MRDSRGKTGFQDPAESVANKELGSSSTGKRVFSPALLPLIFSKQNVKLNR